MGGIVVGMVLRGGDGAALPHARGGWRGGCDV